ncbi:hypothetical protein BOX15_Mlig021033g1, partial [Macrostomum lignano]
TPDIASLNSATMEPAGSSSSSSQAAAADELDKIVRDPAGSAGDPHADPQLNEDDATAYEQLPVVELSRTVLLAVDLTDRSERMIRWYASSAAYFSDQVVLGYIIEPPSMLVGHFTPLSTKEPDYYTIEGGKERARQLGEKLKNFAASIGLPNVEFRSEFYGCSAPVGLLRLAEEIKASVVVVSSRGLGKMKRVVLGSTTDHVLQHSLRPVLVVPPASPSPLA